MFGQDRGRDGNAAYAVQAALRGVRRPCDRRREVDGSGADTVGRGSIGTTWKALWRKGKEKQHQNWTGPQYLKSVLWVGLFIS